MSSSLSQAVAHLEIAVELSPRNARYRSVLGEAHLADGDDISAERHFAVAVNLGAGARTEALWALTLLRLGNLGGALAVVEDALRRHGPFAHGHYVRGLICGARKELPEARMSMRSAAAEADDPSFYEAEEARLETSGIAGLAGLERPLSATFVRRFLRGSGLLQRASRRNTPC